MTKTFTTMIEGMAFVLAMASMIFFFSFLQ
jgi:Na+-transporting methylmalonyl-CoA/oxaloacetate decarboxylase gamma subunit